MLTMAEEAFIGGTGRGQSSIIWLTAGALYLLYKPIELWLFGGR